jgi:uncharacterized protein (TIRG00374 family)
LIEADWWLVLLVAVPANLAAVYIRAVRWRYLTDPIQPISTGPLFRAVSIGLMANNLLPLRMGEFIRAWALARETGGAATKYFGTVVLERVIDASCFILMMVSVLALHRFGDAEQISPRGVAVFAVVAIAGLAAVRFFPQLLLDLLRVFLRPLPDRLAGKIETLVQELMEGLASLRGVRSLLGITFHSILLWAVVSVIPYLVCIHAAGIELGSPQVDLLACYATLVAVGVFIAAPSAPGFFGTFHVACQFALASFGVPMEQGFAAGVLIHLSFWIPVTLLGLAYFFLLRSSLDLDEMTAEQGPAPGFAPTSKDRP